MATQSPCRFSERIGTMLIAFTIAGALASGTARLKAATVGQRVEFDAATLKVSRLVPGDLININLGTTRNNRLTMGNATLSDCIKFAYQLTSNSQIVGPDWINSGEIRYDIDGRAPEAVKNDQLLLMLQNLLADRLTLALHHEQRPVSHLSMTVGKQGVKFGTAEAGGPNYLRPGQILHSSISMQTLATLLSRFEKEFIVNQTGLDGVYNIKLQWTPEAFRGHSADGLPTMMNGQPIDVNGPSLVTALNEQLGLTLQSRKDPVDVLVIDHAEKIPQQ